MALRIIRGEFDYQLLAGQCCEQLERIQEAVEHFVMAVQLKPKKMGGWDALIRCLLEAEAWEDALKQIDLALQATKGKALFLYYRAAVLFGATAATEGALAAPALARTGANLKRLFSIGNKADEAADLIKASKNFYHKITFTDNGIGFEQKYADQIFQLFSRLHNKKDYSGTGVGLSICKKIVDNHQGFIFAKGEINVGATFTIYLPVS